MTAVDISEIVDTLEVQSWSLYAVGMTLIALRMFARLHRLGLRGLQADDYLMLTVAAWYTILITCLNVIAQGGGSNLYPPELFDTFTQEEIVDRIHGSKIVVLSEQAMLNGIYTIKACLLVMYWRLTDQHPQRRWVIWLSCYVAVGWLATQIAFFTACRPFQGYWAMPPPNDQCTTLQYYAYVQACFNLSSDTLMLWIPGPLVINLKVHWKQKMVLGILFSLGIFVIIAAILTKIYNLGDVWDTRYMLWYTRELSVAVYVSNLPLIWPIMREYIPYLRNLTATGETTTNRRSTHGVLTSGAFQIKTVGSSRSKVHPHEGITTIIRGKDEEDFDGAESNEMKHIHRQGSEDRLRPGSDKPSQVSSFDDLNFANLGHSGIHVDTTVRVTEEHVQGPVRAFDGGYGPYRSREPRDSDEHQPPFEWQYEKPRR